MEFLLLVPILDLVIVSDAIINSWNMHFTCGQTISQSDRGGFLVLNSDLLPAGHQYDCRVVIQPESTKSSSTSGYHVLFHFSDFEVGRYCQDTNVTVLDGNGINMSPIEGLKNPLCGSNSSLTTAVTFTTQSYFITVLFQRNTAGANFKSKFNLTFLSFSEGSCASSDDTFFSCTNKRCIDKQFTCQNINPCGDHSDCPPNDPSSNDSFDTVEKIFMYVGVAIFVVFTIGVSCRIFKDHRNFSGDPCCSCSCLGDCLDGVCSLCSRCDCSVCRNGCRGVAAGCSRCKNRCSECRSRCANCCTTLVERMVTLCRRIKGRFTSNNETEDHRDNDNEAQESRQVTSHNTSERNTPSYPNEAYSRDEDNYSSDFESSDSDRDTGRQTDAPPSYHEAAAAPRPLPAVPKEPTAPPMPSDTTAPPSYDEAVSKMTKYTKRK